VISPLIALSKPPTMVVNIDSHAADVALISALICAWKAWPPRPAPHKRSSGPPLLLWRRPSRWCRPLLVELTGEVEAVENAVLRLPLCGLVFQRLVEADHLVLQPADGLLVGVALPSRSASVEVSLPSDALTSIAG